MAKVRRRYLTSGEFNGLHLHGASAMGLREPSVELVRTGMAQVVSGADYMNIHIRPWESRRSLDDQIADLVHLTSADYGICLYPTPAGMKSVRLPKRMMDRPYDKAMARGKGTLELAYFEFDVLEHYRNDSRFRFRFDDAGASMGLSDEAYGAPDVLDRDHVGLTHIGFAYDLSRFDLSDENSSIRRRVAVFYCDLIQLTPEHQRRWQTYEVADSDLRPHPLWWMAQMGNWPDGIGPFARLFQELKSLNELGALAFGEDIFALTSRPDEMGWLLRPSSREWDEFVSLLDKVLSENLRSQFFDRARVPAFSDDGKRLGTLARLGLFLESGGNSRNAATEVLRPLREVRRLRQRPAHTVRENLTDRTFIHRQISLLREINVSLMDIRRWLASHPRCSGWVDEYADLEDYLL